MSIFRSPNRRHDRRYFYKYITTAVAKIILVSHRLRWSSPILFNDPFDITQELRLDFDDARLQVVITETLAKLIESGTQAIDGMDSRLALLLTTTTKLSHEKRLDLAHQIREEPMPPVSGIGMEMLRQVWREEVQKSRIFCVSEQKDIVPMWHHYADKYRGVVLEFEALDETDSPLLMARPVVYQEAPPAISSAQNWANCMLRVADRMTYEHLYTECQYVKKPSWSYEREWRVVSSARLGESGLYADYGFHPRDLSAVFFGSRCSQEDRNDLLGKLIGDLNHVAVWQTIENTSTAQLIFQPLARTPQAPKI